MQTLLLVDDDLAILKQLSFMFCKEYRVLEAQNRQEAIKLIKENRDIDIALVDLGLPPHENSYEEGKIVIEYLLQTSDSKILVLTGQESSEYPKELIRLGIFDYIQKPIDLPSLKNAIKRASFFVSHLQEDSVDSVHLSFKTLFEDGLKGSADEAQKQLLLKVLKQTHFNVNQTSKLLGISRENCYYFLKKFHIERPND